jgi:3-dehydroquinate dehydratase I
MTTRRSVKERERRRNRLKPGRPLLVGVVASPADLRFALRMEQPPDLFELRLDCLGEILNQLERKMSILSAKGRTRRGEKAPVIITARDPREGGMGNLSIAKRRELLSRFLRRAKYLDVELRSARAFKPLLAQARKRNVRVILSFHDFESTPSSRSLRAKTDRAKALCADIFKIASRTDKPADLARLVDFITSSRINLPISAMGIGKLGGISRLLLARCGSVLNYGSLQQSIVAGQLNVEVLRSALPR